MGASQSCNCVQKERKIDTQTIVPITNLSPGRSSPSSSRPLKSPKTPKNIETWDFNTFPLHPVQVEEAALWIIQTTHGDSSGPEADKHKDFTSAVCEGYQSNPYHNRRHALDVMQTVWRLGVLVRWEGFYQVHERLAMVVAALGHDMGHFGVTNAFLVDMRDELAIHYNDISPLENMHCSKLFNVLSADKTNVFSNLSPQDFRNVRKLVIDAILHTDPANHNSLLIELQAMYEENIHIFGAPDDLADATAELLSTVKSKAIFARTLMHGGDLSNPCKPFKIASVWAKAIVEEFFNQGDREKSLGLPVGMLNDRAKVSLPNSQLGFIQFMVVPLAVAYTRLFRSWADLGSMLADNFGEWAKVCFEENGKDESRRVGAVRGILEEAIANSLEITVAADSTNAEDGKPLEITDLDADFTDALVQCMPKSEDYSDSIVVREVRRWRDQGGDHRTIDKSQHRELVLLYVLSEKGEMPVDKDIIMKFGTPHTHFGQDMTQVVNEPPDPDTPIVTVAVSADNMRSNLEQNEFDRLLSALLEKELAVGP